jgi:hypothetical protein
MGKEELPPNKSERVEDVEQAEAMAFKTNYLRSEAADERKIVNKIDTSGELSDEDKVKYGSLRIAREEHDIRGQQFDHIAERNEDNISARFVEEKKLKE